MTGTNDYTLLPASEEVDEAIDKRLEPIVCEIEARSLQQLLQLEAQLREMVTPEAFAIYEQMDSLVATEKGELQRACYSAGVAHVMTQLIIWPDISAALASEARQAASSIP